MNQALIFNFLSLAILLLSAHVLLRRKRFDIYTLAYAGSALYYIPMIYHGIEFYYQTNFIYWLVLISIVISSYVYDAIIPEKNHKTITTVRPSRKENIICIYRLTALVSFVLLLFLLISYGLSDFFVPKQEQLRAGYASTAYAVLVVIGVVMGYMVTGISLRIYFFTSIVLLFASGSRTQAVIAILCLGLLFLRDAGGLYKKYLISKITIFGALAIAGLGIYGKMVYSTIGQLYSYGYGAAFDLIQNYGRANTAGLLGTEPYGIDRMLGLILSTNYRIDPSYLLGLPLQFLPLSGKLSDTLHHFSDSVKLTFFPNWSETAGVGATYWGEGYATFGVAGVLAYLVLFLIILFILNRGFLNSTSAKVGLYTICGAYWGFYIHRNSLFQMVGHLTKYIYIFLALYILCMFVRRRIVWR